jgi:hypothetical protein
MAEPDFKSLLRYEPDTGKLFWLPRATGELDTMGRSKDTKWNSRHAGKEAGALSPVGRRVLGVYGKTYCAHRVIWFLVHGEWPVEIDHINGDPSDNRLVNLRSVTGAENCKNRPKLPNRSSKYLGVSVHKKGRWQATCTVNGKQIYGGLYASEDEAAAKAAQMRRDLNFHPNHGRPLRAFA